MNEGIRKDKSQAELKPDGKGEKVILQRNALGAVILLEIESLSLKGRKVFVRAVIQDAYDVIRFYA